MPIDGRSNMGDRLTVNQPAELDLRQLSEEAGALIIERMERDGSTREAAIIGLLGFAASVKRDGVVSLDTKKIYGQFPEVKDAVDRAIARPLPDGSRKTVARVLTSLIIKGARPAEAKEPPRRPASGSGIPGIDEGVADLLESILGKGRRQGPTRP